MTPLVSVFVTGYLTLAAIGPVFVKVENFVIDGIQTILTLPFGLGSLIVGCLYAVTVVAGIHHMYTTIDIGQLADMAILLASVGLRGECGPGRCFLGGRH